MKKITIKDVAKAAGVSPSTVSNVINGVAKCSEDTKFKILQVMEELNYKPNLNAKALVNRKSNLIGVIFTEYTEETLKEQSDRPFMQNILSGMNSALRESENYDLLITESSNATSIVEWISKRNLDIVILVGMFAGGVISQIQALDIPVVLIDNYYDELKGAIYINSEDTFGGYLAAEHLIKNGCKNFAIATGTLSKYEIFQRRLYGCFSAFEDYGIHFDESRIFEEDRISFSGGKKLGYRITGSGKYDGIIVLGDIMALGILRVLNEKGIKVPDEVSLIGFDNIPACEYSYPQLTTIDQKMFGKGEKAIYTALDILENKTQITEDISIDVELIKREST